MDDRKPHPSIADPSPALHGQPADSHHQTLQAAERDGTTLDSDIPWGPEELSHSWEYVSDAAILLKHCIERFTTLRSSKRTVDVAEAKSHLGLAEVARYALWWTVNDLEDFSPRLDEQTTDDLEAQARCLYPPPADDSDDDELDVALSDSQTAGQSRGEPLSVIELTEQLEAVSSAIATYRPGEKPTTLEDCAFACIKAQVLLKRLEREMDLMLITVSLVGSSDAPIPELSIQDLNSLGEAHPKGMTREEHVQKGSHLCGAITKYLIDARDLSFDCEICFSGTVGRTGLIASTIVGEGAG